MNLPDVDGFIVAAQLALGDHDIVYLHNAEGAPVIALLSMDFWKRVEAPTAEMYDHDHLEPGEPEPWSKVQVRDR